MLRTASHWFKNYIASFFELQFVITLMSLPLLICWGIPLSIMSPLANFIFTPLLVVFLWLSCLATLCIIAHIPTNIFDQALSLLTQLWMYLLTFSKPSWLIGFPKSMLSVSCLICILIVMMYVYIKPKTAHASIVLGSIWLGIILIQPWFTTKSGITKIGTLPLWFTRVHNQTYLIDKGALCNRKNSFTNLDYTVLPELIKHTGHAHVDTILFCKPSTKLSKIAQQCAVQLNCSTCFVTTQAQCFKKVAQNNTNNALTILPLKTKSNRS